MFFRTCMRFQMLVSLIPISYTYNLHLIYRNSNIGEAAKTHDRDRQKFEKTYKSMEDAVATKNSEVGQLEVSLKEGYVCFIFHTS